MSQPPAKRHKPAARPQPRAAEPGASDASSAGGAAIPPCVAAVAALDAQLAPLEGPRQDELKRKRDDLERGFAKRSAELDRRRAELEREQAEAEHRHAEEVGHAEEQARQLARQIAPLRNERDARGGYLQLVAERPSPMPAWLPADAPPSALLAAQRRLAMASLGNARLGTAATLLSDVAELVAPHIRGFDLEAEGEKVTKFGALAFSARSQFRQLSGMREAVVGVLVEGHPQPIFNGVYRVDSEHDGWPVLKNADGSYCYRHRAKRKWLLNTKLTPASTKCAAYIAQEEGSWKGPLPVGARTWKIAASALGKPTGSGKGRRTLTATLLVGPAVNAAEVQFAAELTAANVAQLAAVRAQLDGADGISIAGHPDAAFNGRYTHDSTHEGWPVLKNANGRYCYRSAPRDKWFLRDHFRPEDHHCNASILAKEGPLPVGAHSWKLGPSVLGTAGWVGRTLTVTLLP